MFGLRTAPEYEIALYQSYEQALIQRCELRRLAEIGKPRQPSVADELLLVGGNTLIALGERLRARSIAAGSVA